MYKLDIRVADLYIENTTLAIASARKARAARVILEDRILTEGSACLPPYAEMAANKKAILTKGTDDNPGTHSATFPTSSAIRITVHMTYVGVDVFAVVLAIGELADVSSAEPLCVFSVCLDC
jgi:hypothetical protein